MASNWKEWEKPLLELEEGLARLRVLSEREQDPAKSAELNEKIKEFEKRRDQYIDIRYSRLGPWEKVLLARAEPRPYSLDYINAMFTEFVELRGDRRFGQDDAIVCGPALMDGRPVMVVGHQKGRNMQDRQKRNFAMAKPEGYRKAIRMFQMAERFQMPVITLVDTPAADPGVPSEMRGISEAIADSMREMFELTVPIVSVVIGEGGSGGAIGIAVANKVAMLEHSIYSVIPPEGCAAILWRDPKKGPQAAAALRLTAQSALNYGLIDQIIPEPHGGAHRDLIGSVALVKGAILDALDELDKMSPEELREHRYLRFRNMAVPQGV